MPRKAKSTRRGNKEGTIYQRKDGTWCGQVLLGYKPDGKPNRKTFYGKTREIVAEKITNVSSDNFRGIAYIEPSNMTFKELLNEWLFKFKKSEVAARTFDWYLNIAKYHLYNELGQIPMKKLTAYHIQNLINTKLGNGVSHRTVKAIRETINQCLKHACEMNLLGANPVSGTKLPKNRKLTDDSVKAIPVELRKKLLDALETDATMKAMVTVLMFTGMRVGELLGLPWKNVDFKKCMITIDRAITQSPEFDDEGNLQSCPTIISTTKTYSSTRKFKVSGVVIDTLAQWKALQQKKNVFLVADNAVVFPNKDGKTRTYSGFRTIYVRFLEKNGFDFRHLNPHCYRHTFATMLLESGVNPRIVQKLLGHKNIQITLDTYSHVLTEVFDEVADTVGDIYTATVSGDYKEKIIKLTDKKAVND